MAWGDLLTAAGVVGGLSLAQKQREKGEKSGGRSKKGVKGGKQGATSKQGGAGGGLALAAAGLSAVPTPVAAILVGAAAAGLVAKLILKGNAEQDEEGDDSDHNVPLTPGGRKLSNLTPLTVEADDSSVEGGVGFALDKPRPMSPTRILGDDGVVPGEEVDFDVSKVPLLTPREFFSDSHGWGRGSGATLKHGKEGEKGVQTIAGDSISISSSSNVGTSGKLEAPGTPPQKAEPYPATTSACSASEGDSVPPRSQSLSAVVKAAAQGSPLREGGGGELLKNRSWTWSALSGFIERRLTVSPSSSVKSQTSANSSLSKDTKDPDSPSLGLVDSQTKFARSDSGSFDTAPNSPVPGALEARMEGKEKKSAEEKGATDSMAAALTGPPKEAPYVALTEASQEGPEATGKVKEVKLEENAAEKVGFKMAQHLTNGEAEKAAGEKPKAAGDTPALVQHDARVRALLDRARAATQRASAIHANILEIGATRKQEKE